MSTQLRYVQNIERPAKDTFREQFFNYSKKPIKHYLCMPSETANCIRKGFEMGAFANDVWITFIDKDESVVRKVMKFCLTHFPKANIKGIKGNLFGPRTQKAIRERHELKPIDAAYLDLCGEACNPFLNFNYKMWDVLNKIDNLAYTLCAHKRITSVDIFADSFWEQVHIDSDSKLEGKYPELKLHTNTTITHLLENLGRFELPRPCRHISVYRDVKRSTKALPMLFIALRPLKSKEYYSTFTKEQLQKAYANTTNPAIKSWITRAIEKYF